MLNLGSKVFCSEVKLRTNSNKHLKKVEKLREVYSMYKILSSFAGTTDLIYGFDPKIIGRREEITYIKQDVSKGAFYTRIRLIVVFDFADQDKVIYDLRYIIILKH